MSCKNHLFGCLTELNGGKILLVDLLAYSNMTKEFEKDPSVFYHRLVETYKHVYAYRAKIGDENFLDIDKVGI